MKLNELPRVGFGMGSIFEKRGDRRVTTTQLYNPIKDAPLDNYSARFIELLTDDGRTYILAGANRDCFDETKFEPESTHRNVFDYLQGLLDDSEPRPKVIGGGHLRIGGTRLSMFDQSDRFGKFNVSRVEPVVRQYVQENMPYIKEVSVS